MWGVLHLNREKMVKEYEVNKEKAKELYLRTRKNYKRWNYGFILSIMCSLEMSIYFIWLIFDGKFLTYRVLIGLLYLFLAFCTGIMAVSVKMKILRLGMSSKLILSEKGLTIEYIPKFNFFSDKRVRYKISYGDISFIQYDQKYECLNISGKFTIKFFKRTESGWIPVLSKAEHMKNKFFSIYNYYEEYDDFFMNMAEKHLKAWLDKNVGMKFEGEGA